VLVGPTGPTGERYDKMRLVPFGEYIPARAALGWVTAVGEAAAEDRRRGREPVVMDLPATGGDLRIGPLVCFETAFPDMSRNVVREGATVLVAQSATSTFQQSWAPRQHASLAALRAAETWRPVVHATLTGVTAVHGARGERLGERLGADRRAKAVYEVPLGGGTSPYVRLGDWVVYASLAALAVFAAAEGVRALTRPGPPPSSPAARTANGSAAPPRR
jgi:apolipoprotein N-acyltransferase